MADYSLQDFWWNKPPRAESQLPALQLGVQIVQRKAQQDLQERDLANDIARTALLRDELLAKQQIQMQVTAGNAEVAATIAEITDWSDAAQVARVWRTASKYPMLPESKAVLGAQHMHESAVAAKTRAMNTESLIARRTAQTELATWEQTRKDLLADSTIDVNDSRLLEVNERIALGRQKQALEEQKFELQAMLADSTMEWNDARVLEKRKNIDLSERRLLIQEGNLALRKEELGQKGRRLDAREQAGYNNELKALNEEEKAKLKSAEGDATESDRLRKLYNLKRRAITGKFYGPASTNAPAASSSAPAAPPGTNSPAKFDPTLPSGAAAAQAVIDTARKAALRLPDAVSNGIDAALDAAEDRLHLLRKEGIGPATQKPITKEEYDKLAPGTKYIAPDGTERTKG